MKDEETKGAMNRRAPHTEVDFACVVDLARRVVGVGAPSGDRFVAGDSPPDFPIFDFPTFDPPQEISA